MKYPIHLQDIIAETQKDLLDDFAELLYLYTDAEKKINIFLKKLQQKKRFIEKDSYQSMFQRGTEQNKIFREKINVIQQVKKEIKANYKNEQQLLSVIKTKQQLFDFLRTQQIHIGSLLTASDWQSPSFLFSLQSQAGVQTGQIVGNFNDYKRDHHLDEKEYEEKFKKEYIDGWIKGPIHVYVTNSGMAAFTTVVLFLLMEKKLTDKVVVGKSIYFENRELLLKLLKNKIIEVDEHDIKEIERVLKKEKISAVFFDSLTNKIDMPVPNLTEVLNVITKYMKDDLYFVIDNTCLATTYQPIKAIFGKHKKIYPIIFESLNKYHQFGMDRITGGIIYAYGKDTYKLFNVREHAGTNIADTSVHAVPTPQRKHFEKRLQRLERNTFFMAETIQQYLQQGNIKKIASIIYPGLATHPAYAWTQNMQFHGSYFVIQFTEQYKKVSIYKRFVNQVMQEAKKQKVRILSGTSFGLTTTRIYLTSARSDYGEPFVRVAVGTETRIELEKIKNVFIKAIKTFEKRLFLL